MTGTIIPPYSEARMLQKTPQSLLLAAKQLVVINNFAWLPHRRAVPSIQGTPGAFLWENSWWTLTPKLTFCNDYATCFCACFGAELPPLLVGEQLAWLESPAGLSAGWAKLGSREAARQRVEAGGLVICITTAKIPHGHIAVGVPSPVPGEFHISAAGGANYINTRLENSFGSFASELEYFEHLPPI